MLFADVIKMGFVTVLRTGVAYFLAREIKELEEIHQEQVTLFSCITRNGFYSFLLLILQTLTEMQENELWNAEETSSTGSGGELKR